MGAENVGFTRSDNGWLGDLGGGLALVALPRSLHRPWHPREGRNQPMGRATSARPPQPLHTSHCRYGWGRSLSPVHLQDVT
ncbi:hypothetical protein [Reticulibacter mediterranei]|uniref:hypothetical protein n=1 Tax=Reticulibacter mediterranei TaxID=2778369 RepID=UPI001C693AD3|nr:hypothetical protein [Reticulibacter mediterranei]